MGATTRGVGRRLKVILAGKLPYRGERGELVRISDINRIKELMENTTGKLLNYYTVESINFPSYMKEIISQAGETRVWMCFWCGQQ